MLRTTILALATATALGTASLVPTVASAHDWRGGWHHHWGWHHGWGWREGWRGRFWRPGYAVYPVYGGCWVRRWVATPYGPALRLVNRCY
jgi:hypothetical protein